MANFPHPTFYTEGAAPLPQDTEHRIWTKILGRIQNRGGSNSANNPLPNDTLAQTKEKVAKALGA